MISPKPREDKPARIQCIDQLRGYAIFGMLLVNSSALFFDPIKRGMQGTAYEALVNAIIYQVHHHRTHFTFADTIAPLFVFVVGMGMRLSWRRRIQKMEPGEIRKSMAKRFMLLVLIAFAIYAGWLWDALMYIGLSGLLAVMLIDKKPHVRILAAFIFVAAFQCLHSFTSYGTWSVHGKFSLEDPDYVPLLVRLVPLHGELFDCTLAGGPLGSLGWVMMLLFGTYAYDVLAERNTRKLVLTCLGLGAGLCAVGYALHVEWPGIKEEWPFSARYMTAPFPFWATGLAFFALLAFYLLCDKLHVNIPTFSSVGMNPLVIYISTNLFFEPASDFAPEKLTVIGGIFGFAVFWAICAGAAYYMRRNKIYIKI